MRSATFFAVFACSLAVVSMNESSLLSDLFKWNGGWDFAVWALGAADSYLESETPLAVEDIQHFVDGNMQRYRDTLVKEGRDLREHFLDSAYLEHVERSIFSQKLTFQSELSNITLEGLSRPIINTITKNDFHTEGKEKIVSYSFWITYPTLSLHGNYYYFFHSRVWDSRNDIRCSGRLSIKMINTTVKGTIEMAKYEDEKVPKIAVTGLEPSLPLSLETMISRCNTTNPNRMAAIWNIERIETGKELRDQFLPVIEAKISRNLNALINTTGFPAN